jgi:hypothetical protein
MHKRLSLYLAAGMLLVIAAVVMRRGDTFDVAVGVLLIVAAASITLGALFRRPGSIGGRSFAQRPLHGVVSR